MKKLIQYRQKLDNCVLSKLYHQGKFLVHTVEKPWLSNRPDISCVPPGIYTFKPVDTPQYKNVFALENPDLGVSLNGETTRTGILMHIFNFPRESKGCIGPGLFLHPTTWGVSQSTDAMNLLRRLIGSDMDWKLEII